VLSLPELREHEWVLVVTSQRPLFCVPGHNWTVRRWGGLRDRTLQRHLKLLIQRGFVCDAKTGATDPTNYYEPVLSQPITSQLVHSTYV
jgi:hypothetical protein